MKTNEPDEPVYNKLLERQLRKHLNQHNLPANLKPLLQAVSEAYDNFEHDRQMIERAMDLNSEELLGTNDELRKANQELDQFVYSVSHDLRAPIASVLGLLNIVESESNPKDRQHYHQLMRQSLQRLDSFIHDIIDYSRNNRLENQPEPIDFNELVEEVAAGLRYMPNAKEVELRKNFSQPVTIYSDKRRLKMILSNLIGNAVRYRHPSREQSYVEIRLENMPGKETIFVEDNGLGIDSEYLDRIFDMFFRAHEKSQGSGLGLYIVKEAVKKLGGSIEVSSVVNQGTRFKIDIPKMAPVAEAML